MKASQNYETSNSPANSQGFIIEQFLKGINTHLPCTVKKAHPAPLGPSAIAGFVDVDLAIDELDNEGKRIETKTIYNIPYFRLQAGVCAVVVDPRPGDIGWLDFCQRDISKFKETRKRSIPDSWRMLTKSDAVYVGGIRNEPPKIYIQLHTNPDDEVGITIESDVKNLVVHVGGTSTIHCEKDVTINCDANVTATVKEDATINVGGDATVKVDGDINAQASNATVKASKITLDGDVGITGKLDVGGNISSGGNITASGNITAGGKVSGDSVSGGSGGMSTTGQMSAASVKADGPVEAQSMSTTGDMTCGGNSTCAGTSTCGGMQCNGDSNCTGNSTCGGTSTCGGFQCNGNSSCTGNSSCGGTSSCGGLSCTGNSSCGGISQATDFEIPGLGKLSDLLGGGP